MKTIFLDNGLTFFLACMVRFILAVFHFWGMFLNKQKDVWFHIFPVLEIENHFRFYLFWLGVELVPRV